MIKCEGCNTSSLGFYLKALGVFRLLGKAFPDVRSYWNGSVMVFDVPNGVDEKKIMEYFLNSYCPTPIISPWNRSGGFLNAPKDIKFIEDSKDPRLSNYREAIRIGHECVSKINIAEFNEKKNDLILDLRNRLIEENINSGKEWPVNVVNWIDTAGFLLSDNSWEPSKIMTTGGNESRLEYSINYMKAIKFILTEKREKVAKLLENALFSTHTEELTSDIKMGKFIPSRSGGYNMGIGFSNKEFYANPWDFVFLMEGSLLFSSSMGKRPHNNHSFIRTPFTVASDYDGENEEQSYEVWAPLWKNPAKINEIEKVFKNGRVEIGNRAVYRSIEFLTALKNFGVDRGIYRFNRWRFLRRRGQNYIAADAGYYEVRFERNYDLMKEILPIMERLDNFLKRLNNNGSSQGQAVPQSLRDARQALTEAITYIAKHGMEGNVERLFYSIGKLERLFSLNKYSGKPVLSGLTTRWIEINRNGSNEFFIAAAISSIRSIRRFIEPIDEGGKKWEYENSDFSWYGSNIYQKMINVLNRLLLRSEMQDKPPELKGRLKLPPAYANRITMGEINEDLLENLIYGLSWINWGDTNPNIPLEMHEPIPYDYSILKLIYLGHKIKCCGKDNVRVDGTPQILSTLASGKVDEAVRMAKVKLRVNGIPVKDAFHGSTQASYRLAASLLLPVDYRELLGSIGLTPFRSENLL